MKTVFNKKKTNFAEEPMFFGSDLAIQRFDVYKYPIYDKLTQTQLGYFWRPEEVSLQKDRNDFQTLREEHKFIFTSNLKYQTLLDSVQGRGPALAFLPHVSLPELEACIITWDFFETIHSRSYTYIMKNVYSNPEELFDSILGDPAIMKRAASVTKNYDNFINYVDTVKAGQGDRKELKKRFYLALLNVNILEGIRFYVSFACSFAFGELKLMEGSAKILSLIARDESQHLAITQNIINTWRKNPKEDIEMTRIMKECEDEVYAMYDKAVDEEKEWANHLFKNGSMIGLNERLLHQYIEYITNRRMRAIGLEARYDHSMNHNPLPWTKNWLSSKGLQNAPQETEIESYLIGGIKQDIEKDTFKDFKL